MYGYDSNVYKILKANEVWVSEHGETWLAVQRREQECLDDLNEEIRQKLQLMYSRVNAAKI